MSSLAPPAYHLGNISSRSLLTASPPCPGEWDPDRKIWAQKRSADAGGADRGKKISRSFLRIWNSKLEDIQVLDLRWFSLDRFLEANPHCEEYSGQDGAAGDNSGRPGKNARQEHMQPQPAAAARPSFAKGTNRFCKMCPEVRRLSKCPEVKRLSTPGILSPLTGRLWVIRGSAVCAGRVRVLRQPPSIVSPCAGWLHCISSIYFQ